MESSSYFSEVCENVWSLIDPAEEPVDLSCGALFWLESAMGPGKLSLNRQA